MCLCGLGKGWLCGGVREGGGRPPGRGKRRVPAVRRHHPLAHSDSLSAASLKSSPCKNFFHQQRAAAICFDHGPPARQRKAAPLPVARSVKFAFNSCFSRAYPKEGTTAGALYSTHTVDATSEYSQQGWCGVCLCVLGKGWLCGGVREQVYGDPSF